MGRFRSSPGDDPDPSSWLEELSDDSSDARAPAGTRIVPHLGVDVEEVSPPSRPP